MKTCKACGSQKDHINGAWRCHPCRLARGAEYRERNREALRVAAREYHQKKGPAPRRTKRCACGGECAVSAKMCWTCYVASLAMPECACGVRLQRRTSQHCKACWLKSLAQQKEAGFPAKRRREIARARAWAIRNPEKRREIHRKWRNLHAAQEKASSLAWRERNREAKREAGRRHYALNRERWATYKANRRARERGSDKRLSPRLRSVLMDAQRGLCKNCCADLKVTGSHLDHVVPLALGGENVDGNIQLLCPPCNRRKGAKHPEDFSPAAVL